MIRFIKVQGNVWIDDRKGQQTLAPTPGMTFQNEGADCIIAAGHGGGARFLVNGKQVELDEGHRRAHEAATHDFALVEAYQGPATVSAEFSGSDARCGSSPSGPTGEWGCP